MALKATIYKADIHIADMDRHYYQEHNLTIARHPSETDERMMIRILAFALNASDELRLSKGLEDINEPEIWHKDLTEEIKLWIDLGTPDEKRIRKACHKSQQVIIYSYGGRSAQIWWDTIKKQLTRFSNLKVYNIAPQSSDVLSSMARRTMQLHFTIEDGQVSVSDSEQSLALEPEVMSVA